MNDPRSSEDDVRRLWVPNRAAMSLIIPYPQSMVRRSVWRDSCLALRRFPAEFDRRASLEIRE